MKIERVFIQNYRSIKKLDFQPRDLCALVGENNAGKSNILRALNVMLGESWPSERSFSDEDFFEHDRSNELVIQVIFDSFVEWERSGVAKQVYGFRLSCGQYKRAASGKRAGDPKFDFICVDQNGKPITVPSRPFMKGQPAPSFLPLKVTSELRENFPFIYVDVWRDYDSHAASSRWSALNRLFRDVNDEFARDTVEVPGTSDRIPRKELYYQKVKELFDLLRTPLFVDIETKVRDYALEQLGLNPALDDVGITFQPFDPYNVYRNMQVVITEGATTHLASQVGAGYQSSLVVAIFRAYQELKKGNAIIAVEEPEGYLHPHRQRFFYKVLRNIANQGNQVFYTTHSANFVDVIHPENVYIVRKEARVGTQVASCPPQQWSPSQREAFKLMREFDPERNELFFSRYCALVEGDTEKFLFPALLKQLGIDCDETGVSVIEVGGKSNLPIFIEVLQHFKIPFVVIHDVDVREVNPEWLPDRQKRQREDNQHNQKLNTEIQRTTHDSARIFTFTPDLEEDCGFNLGKKDKVRRAIEFSQGTISASIWRKLTAPFETLLDREFPFPETQEILL